MTLNEAAYNLLNLLVGGRSTNNEYYSIEQIKFNIKYYRALLTRREIDRLGGSQETGGGQGGTHNSSTSLMELRQSIIMGTSAITISGNGIFSDTFPAESTYITNRDIPRYIRVKGRSGIIGITIDNFPVPMVYERYSFLNKYNKYTSSSTMCYLTDSTPLGDDQNKIVVVNWTGGLPDLVVTGIWEDPEDAHNLSYSGGYKDAPWSDDLDEFPLPMDMYQRIVSSIINGEFRLLIQTPTDTKHDLLPDRG